ncbi:DHA2 family efflux MFS transporter permease subunit [Sinomonas susongensis]|uniref:DHA2 family efflux MFS transporter permease subunit n=1 Tax=Sinomonas susongensis TaxID=1324851 RepID=UPI001108AB2A|nr:DHA2 family efflux MFS transporter permease subunit [Sinomonas susongensis]
MSSSQHFASQTVSAPGRLGRELGGIIAIVVGGALVTVLDATVVSIAVDTLAARFHAPLAEIQWVITAYLVAMTAVIPLTGYAADRFGGRRVWMAAVALFVLGSALASLAWSAESLIAFRAVQGLGGGMVVPVGMSLVAQSAGRERMGRAMSMVSIPMMLGPVLGPVLGGLLVSAADWRWIFLINIPIGLAVLAFSPRILPKSEARPGQRLDAIGLALLSPGLTALVYGLSTVTESAGIAAAWAGAGAVLIAAFVWRALGRSEPLLELRHFASRTFAVASLIQFLLGGVLIGSMLLLPLYYQQARGLTAGLTGLLLIPQGLGAALALYATGPLVDRGRGRAVVLTGAVLLSAGLAVYALAPAEPPFAVLVGALLVAGLGTGCTMTPLNTAAYSVIERVAIPRATATLSIVQRVGGALGTATFAVVLSSLLAGAHSAAGVASAFGAVFWLPVTAVVLVVPLAALLPAPDSSPSH